MKKSLCIISGITGSGKTTYVDLLKSPHVHFDQIYSYQSKILKMEKIKEMILNYPDAEVYFLDAFIFDWKKLEELKAYLFDTINYYSVYFLYCSLEDLYQNQMLKHKESKGYWCKTDPVEASEYNIFRSVRTTDNLKNLLTAGYIDKLSYIFREVGRWPYTYFNDDIHYNKTLGILKNDE